MIEAFLRMKKFDIAGKKNIREIMIKDNKQAAVQFFKLVVAGNIDDAYEKYVNMKGKHHNCYFPAGFTALKKAMIDAHTEYPNKQFNIKNVLGDGDLVAVHSHIVMSAGEKEYAVVHLFRFANNKIVEMWDIGQPITSDLPNKDGAF